MHIIVMLYAWNMENLVPSKIQRKDMKEFSPFEDSKKGHERI